MAADMDVLIIGAARPPCGDTCEKELRMWNGVFSDIKTIYGFCQDPKFACEQSGSTGRHSLVNVFQTLVNWDTNIDPSLMPPSEIISHPDDERPPLQRYESKAQVRDRLRTFLQEAPGPNLMIYFSGHGLYQPTTEEDLLSEVLCLPVTASASNDGSSDLAYYNSSELTMDINDSLRQRRSDAADGGSDEPAEREFLTVYLVIDACHAEGLVNFFDLVKEVRMDEQTAIILFAGAEARLDASYDAEGGVFTRSFRRRAAELKGRPVSDIAEKILEDIFDNEKPTPPSGQATITSPTSPCVRYSRPKLCNQIFLG